MDVRFKVPSNFYISGQSQCGKSYLVRRLLYYLNELFHPVPSKVIYCYGEYQKEFDELRGVDFIEGFPQDLNELTQGHDQTLLVLDDLMSECSKDQRVSDLFTRGSHHKGISVLYLSSYRPRVKGDFHAWRVFLARRVDAAWKSRYKFRVHHPPGCVDPAHEVQ